MWRGLFFAATPEPDYGHGQAPLWSPNQGLLKEAGRALRVRLSIRVITICAALHESLRTTPAVVLGIANRVWTIGDLLDAALAVEPPAPTETARNRRRMFRIIEVRRP
jgi:hypothetical protein